MKPIISARNLGKEYTLPQNQTGNGYGTLREFVASLPKRLLSPLRTERKTFWALHGLDFDIHPGERVGLIGRNGAGKSTLLKILSRITEPTTGEITLRGRVGSLLEVGAGFHPELSGRENVYLNGAILGMSRAAIRKRFDEIIDFAEVELFIDMPVKHYSSGMYMRLAFSIAAHLDQEILLIDEVLAVGDLDFQRKCMGKMEEISHKDGRTIMFVSHSFEMLRQFCDHGMFLHKGKLAAQGDFETALAAYLQSGTVSPHVFKTMDDLITVLERSMKEHPKMYEKVLRARTENFSGADPNYYACPGDGRYQVEDYWKKMLTWYALTACCFGIGKRLLDIKGGCGWGGYILSRYANSVTVLEPDKNILAQAKKYWNSPNVEWVSAGAEQLLKLYDEASFDTIIFSEALVFCSENDLLDILNACVILLRSGGTLILTSYFPDSEEEMERMRRGNSHLKNYHIFSSVFIRKAAENFFEEYAIIANQIFVGKISEKKHS